MKVAAFLFALITVPAFAATPWETYETQKLAMIHQQLETFEHDVTALCTAVDDDSQSLEEQGASYQQALDSLQNLHGNWLGYQLLAPYRLEASGLAFRFSFWPDRKDLTRRQAQALLASNTMDFGKAPAPAVALGGAEYVLSAQQAPASQSCRYFTAWIINFSAMLQQVESITNTPDQATLAFQFNQYTSLLGMTEKRIDAVAGSKTQLNLYGMEGWRTGSQLIILGHLFNAIREMEEVLKQQTDAALWNDFDAVMVVLSTGEEPQMPLKSWVIQKTIVESLVKLLVTEMAPELGITIGFSNLDGD
ncbi:hypothetical protein [Gynuella sp.]|uniref:hypothetical protein n=1 Tax=Gynuella sp. TaxID=2969146 RepID=UPI003D0D845C